MEKTIAAISTPFGKGAISIVRMSGKDSLLIAKKVFDCKAFLREDIEPRRLFLGNFDLDGIKEKCLAVYFKAPFSYTGQDMIEFQIHGGTILTQKVLEKLLQSGAVLAEPGEFTRLAFENGKISLDEAEAIADEINAESESELKASLQAGEGQIKAKVKAMQSSLTEELAKIEASLDYPEEDFEKSAIESIKKSIKNVKKEINLLLEQSKNAKFIQKGVQIAIVGRTNVGKSSLLNALVGQDRAIVTEIEGTTRDSIEETTYFKGIKFNFVDTAGIRQAQDKVEKIGIEKSKAILANADIVLLVFDGSQAWTDEDRQIQKLLKDKKQIIIVNKADKKRILPKFDHEIEISALKKQNIEKIKQEIFNKVINEEIDFSKTVVTSQRQISILQDCLQTIEQILTQNTTMDIVAMQIKQLWNELGKITGESENEQIIDLIFTKFCLGK